MAGRAIHSYHFDSDQSFVGLSISGEDNNDSSTMYVAVGVDELTMVTSRETFLWPDDKYKPGMTSYFDSTRLIGFRTGKDCK